MPIHVRVATVPIVAMINSNKSKTHNEALKSVIYPVSAVMPNN